MKNNTLYIIGNGFDLAHGLPSSFKNFENVVADEYFKNILPEENYKRYQEDDNYKNKLKEKYDYTGIEKYIKFTTKDLWSDFEENIINITPQVILDLVEALMDVRVIGNGYSLSVNDQLIVRDIQIGIHYSYYSFNKSFKNWLKHLNNQLTSTHIRCPELKRNALFLNFNYTNTLEHIYSINTNHILHIHGTANDNFITIGGCAEKFYDTFEAPEIYKRREEITSEEHQQWYELVIDQLRSAYEIFSKNVYSKIDIHEEFFNKLSAIKDIYILGHSLNYIDQPYFQKIAQITNKNKPTWHVVYYIADKSDQEAEEKEKARICTFLQDIIVDPIIDLIESTNYYKETMSLNSSSE